MVAIDVPDNADPAACCVVFGLIDLKHSESASAIVAFQQAIALRPKDPIAHWMLAQAFMPRRKPDDAIAALEAAIANRPAKMDLLEIYKSWLAIFSELSERTRH